MQPGGVHWTQQNKQQTQIAVLGARCDDDDDDEGQWEKTRACA